MKIWSKYRCCHLTVDPETPTLQNGKVNNRARLNNDIIYGRWKFLRDFTIMGLVSVIKPVLFRVSQKHLGYFIFFSLEAIIVRIIFWCNARKRFEILLLRNPLSRSSTSEDLVLSLLENEFLQGSSGRVFS